MLCIYLDKESYICFGVYVCIYIYIYIYIYIKCFGKSIIA